MSKKKSNNKDKGESPRIKSYEFLIPQFTREGLIYALSNRFKTPSGVYFESEEFEIMLKKMGQEYNTPLSSFITKLYDCEIANNDFTKTNFALNYIGEDIKNPTLSIFGISNEKSYFQNLPDNALASGFLPRFNHYLGTKRNKIVYKPGRLDGSINARLKSILSLINMKAQELVRENRIFNFEFSEEVDSLWQEKYRNIKLMLDSDQENIANPSIYRDGNTIFKLAAIFELVIRASEIIYGGSPKGLFDDKYISIPAYCMAADWVDYYIQTDLYLFHSGLIKGVDHYQALGIKIINFLKEYPDGQMWSVVKKEVGLHRSKNQTILFTNIISELIREGSVEIIEETNKKIIKLRDYLNIPHTC
jgi:hypothetical protein